MAPLMWRTLNINRKPKFTNLHDRHRIVPFIRELHMAPLHHVVDSFHLFEDPHHTDNFLPENQLRSLKFDVAIPVGTLHHLLRRQGKLRSLSFGLKLPRDKGTPIPAVDLIIGDELALKALAGLKEMVVTIPGYTESLFRNHGHLIRRSLRVENLVIRCVGYQWTADAYVDGLFGSHPGFHPLRPPQRLDHIETLSLDRLPLAGPQDAFMQFIDFSRLKRLDIVECDRIASFLQALADAFLQGGCNLKILRIDRDRTVENRERGPQELTAINALLGSFSGLTQLVVNTGEANLIDKSSITHHGPSLRLLSVWGQPIGKWKSHDYYENDDLAAIVDSCPKLHTLCLSLRPIFVQRLIDEGKNFSIGHGTDLDTSLVGAACAFTHHYSLQRDRK